MAFFNLMIMARVGHLVNLARFLFSPSMHTCWGERLTHRERLDVKKRSGSPQGIVYFVSKNKLDNK